jgi:glycosyltransferase 2 family protein
LKQFLVLLFSILLVILLILWIGPNNIVKALETADWWFILLAAIIHLIVVWIRSVRWGFIIHQTTEFKKNFVVKTIGLFAGNFSPMKSAGEVLTAVAGKKINEISLSEGLSAGLTERFFDLAIVGSLLIIAGLFLPKIRFIAIAGGALSLTVMFIVYLINWREGSGIWIYDKIHPLISKLPIKKEFLDNLYHRLTKGLEGMISYANSFSSFKNLTFVFILSFMSWILECVRLYTVFYAFHVEMNFVAIIIIFLLANVIGVISALPGGIGSIEISLTGLFVLFGVPSALAGSIALIDRLVSFWLVNALGIIFSAYYARDILDEIKKYTLNLSFER